jgi:protein phosphatase
MRVEVGVKTDVGRVRDGNEDSYLARMPLFAVADGMGGHQAGEVASQTAIKAIVDTSATRPPASPEDLEAYVLEANHNIWDKATKDPRLRGMGTTCTLVYVDGSTAYLAHVGDSRAYLWRAGELSQVTEDHTLVQRMVNEGKLGQEEAARHPQKNIITRALGGESDVQVDLLTLELRAGDRLLINSDGLSSMIDDELIGQILGSAGTPDEAAEGLVAAANEAGGEDNITAVVLYAGEDDPNAPLPRSTATSPPPARSTTSPVESGDERTGGRWVRKIVIAIMVIAVLGAGAFGATRYALSHSWFIGASGSGAITIYKGIPDQIAGVTLKEEVRESDLRVKDLPPSFRSDVIDGVKKDSLAEAEATITNYRALIKNFQNAGSGSGNKPKPKPTPRPSKSGRK